MSLLNVKFTPFPSLLSSPSASSSRAPTSLPGRTRSWCQSADAPARWRESGRLVDSAPNTGYEPNLANSSSCTHPEHTAIDIPHRHQDFWCSDVVTMMSTSAKGIPNSVALSSSCKAAVSKASSGAELDRESVATTIFSSLSRGKRYRDTNVVHALRDRENPQKILERKVGLVVQGQKDAQQKLY